MHGKDISCVDKDLSDEQLIESIHSGTEGAFELLSERYAPMIYGKASDFERSIATLERDDLVQEAYIAFLQAVNRYRPEKNVGFKTYANRCIYNKLVSIYNSEKLKKKIPYDCIVPLDNENQIIGNSLNPEQRIIDDEGFAVLQEKISKSLSSFEQKVLSQYLSGSSYVQTAQSLNTTVKAVDNALTRIRKKLRGQSAFD